MVSKPYLLCYLCGRENRIPPTVSGAATLRCGACGALLVDVIPCSSCGTKNRVRIKFVEHQKLTCDTCQALLTNYQFDYSIHKSSASKNMLYSTLTLEGKMYQWKGNWENAIQLFQQAKKYSKKTPEENTYLSVSLGICHAYLGNHKKARQALKHLDHRTLDEFSLVYELARAYGLIGNLEKAIAAFEKASELPAETSSVHHFGSLLETLYDLRETDINGSNALQTSILLYDAMRDYETNNIQAGVQKLSRALELDSSTPVIYHQLGIGLLHQGQFEQAVSMLERGLEFDPSNEQAQFALGDAYFYLGLYECALNAYKQTLHLNPQHIDAYHHLGLVYEQQGEIDVAKGYWEDVLKVRPHHKDALSCLKRHRN